VGELRALVTGPRWLRAAAEMLMVGALAATVSCLVGAWISPFA
jgi:hypothetical protein